MQESDNMFILKFLTYELYEKLYRLRKYCVESKSFDKQFNNEATIDLFLISTEKIAVELSDSDYSDLGDDLNNVYDYILHLDRTSRAINYIHKELRYLNSSWIIPEVKSFISDLDDKNLVDPSQINIILSDNYAFVERNIGKQFDKILSEQFPSLRENEINGNHHSFILPKIDYSNPLNWSIIAHEYGHLLRNDINALTSDPNLIPDDINPAHIPMIRSWAEEIFCDVYATSVLGPSYLLSFLTYTLLNPFEFGINAWSKIHPSVFLRGSFISGHINKNNLGFKSDFGITEYDKIFYDSMLYLDEVLSKYVPREKQIPGLTKFYSTIEDHVRNLNIRGETINQENSDTLKALRDNLQHGIPIGSILRNSESMKIGKLLKKDDLEPDEVSVIKDSVTERSTSIWEIINSGWLHKIKFIEDEAEDIFNGKESVVDKLNIYGEEIDFLDSRLLNSLSVAKIIDSIE